LYIEKVRNANDPIDRTGTQMTLGEQRAFHKENRKRREQELKEKEDGKG